MTKIKLILYKKFKYKKKIGRRGFSRQIIFGVLFLLIWFQLFQENVTNMNSSPIQKSKVNQTLKQFKSSSDKFLNAYSPQRGEYPPNNMLSTKSTTSMIKSQPSPDDIIDAYALVCGVSDYPGTENDLNYCDDDAREIASFLQTEFVIPQENIVTLINENVTQDNINSTISNISQIMDSNDYFFMSYSGHGSGSLSTSNLYFNAQSPHPYSNNYYNYWHYSAPGAVMMRLHFFRIETEAGIDEIYVGDNDYRESYFTNVYSGNYFNVWSDWVLCDDIYVDLWSDYSITDWGFQVDRVEVRYWAPPYELSVYDDGLTGDELDSMLEVIPGKSVIVLDSCNSGGVGSAIQDPDRYVITASQSNEFSLELPSLHNGIFSYYFLNSWNIQHDVNADDALSFEEIFPAVYSSTVSRSSSEGSVHHPQEYDQIMGDVIFHPNAYISSMTNDSNLNVVVNFSQSGLGWGSLYTAYYDQSNQNYSIQLQNTTLLSAGGFRQQEVSAPISPFTTNGITSVLTAQYGGIMNSANISIADFLLDLNDNDDFDEDGINDSSEFYLGLNPWSNDSDEDGFFDYFELITGLEPRYNDTDLDLDNDGLSNALEVLYGTRINATDSDEDGLNDFLEVIVYSSNPLWADTDNDSINDGDEVHLYGIDPTLNDTDGDMILDGYEVNNDLNPNFDDSGLDFDEDGVLNIVEYGCGSYANQIDSDADGCPDGWEFQYGFNLTSSDDALTDIDADGLTNFVEFTYNGNPLVQDTDGDGLSDFLEIQMYYSLDNEDSDNNQIFDLYEDFDQDGLSNEFELHLGTSMIYLDSDDDGCSDGWEYNYGLNFLQADGYLDSDGDGLTNIIEYEYNGNPLLDDTDGDGASDGIEYEWGTDLNDTDTDNDGVSDNLEFYFGTDPLSKKSKISLHLIAPLMFLLSVGIVVISGKIAKGKTLLKDVPIKVKPLPAPRPLYSRSYYTTQDTLQNKFEHMTQTQKILFLANLLDQPSNSNPLRSNAIRGYGYSSPLPNSKPNIRKYSKADFIPIVKRNQTPAKSYQDKRKEAFAKLFEEEGDLPEPVVDENPQFIQNPLHRTIRYENGGINLNDISNPTKIEENNPNINFCPKCGTKVFSGMCQKCGWRWGV